MERDQVASRLRNRQQSSYRAGSFIELRYQRIFPDAVKSSPKDDVQMHVDYWHGDEGVDIKGNVMPDSIWIEFKNVQGELGWVFGKAKWIAFDMPELGAFIRVLRQDLVDWCKENVEYQEIVPKKDCYRKGYRRKDRKDLITRVCLADLQELDSYEEIGYEMTYNHPLTGELMTIERK
jgi:hypothetical protein